MTNAELLTFLFDGTSGGTEEPLLRWVRESRRFQAFLVDNRTKIRKKLRLAQEAESRQSLLLELEIAYRFLQNAKCQVEYEKYGQSNQRNPDLTVTVRTHTIINVEATVVQMPEGPGEDRAEKWMRIICGKLGQNLPQMHNYLVVATAGGWLDLDEMGAVMKSLKLRVEQRDSILLARAGCKTPADFFKQFQWLNAIVVRSVAGTGGEEPSFLWNNPQVRSPLPSDIDTLLKKAML